MVKTDRRIKIGDSFNLLTVIEPGERTANCGVFRWKCRCVCGNYTLATGGSLRSGNKKSCGCLRQTNTTVNGVKTKEYRIWDSMRQRCGNPNDPHFEEYGGRGIHVCSEWEKYSQFIADMGLKPSAAHTLERIDNNLGYSKSNCRWATRKEQANNRRSNVYLTLQNRTQTMAQWADELGVPLRRLSERRQRGLCDADILLLPKRYDRQKRKETVCLPALIQ